MCIRKIDADYDRYSRSDIISFIESFMSSGNIEEALCWAKFLAAYDDGWGFYKVGEILMRMGETKRALEALSIASDRGVQSASLLLAQIYREGRGEVGRDDEKYFYYLHRAVCQRVDFNSLDVDQWMELSQCYRDGIGCEKNDFLSAYWCDLSKGLGCAYNTDEWYLNPESFLEYKWLPEDAQFCRSAGRLWYSFLFVLPKFYESLLILDKGIEVGESCAKAIVGKYSYCIPYLRYMFEHFEEDFFQSIDEERYNAMDVIHERMMPFEWPASLSGKEKQRIQDYGLELLREAASEGNYSAQLTLHRIEINDSTLPFMLSPFQP